MRLYATHTTAATIVSSISRSISSKFSSGNFASSHTANRPKASKSNNNERSVNLDDVNYVKDIQ